MRDEQVKINAMSSLDLPIEEESLTSILRRYGVEKASVCGSFSRGEATEDSDLDLLVTYKPDMTLFEVIDLQTDLEQAVKRPVDLVSAKHLSARLARRIKSDLRPLNSLHA